MRMIDLDELMKFPIRRDHCDKENANPNFIDGIETVFEYAENLPTVRWIPVSERLPTKDDANRLKNVIAIFKREDFARCWHYETIIRHPTQFTHWMPLPDAPMEDDT